MGVNYKFTRDEYAGSQITETGITRVGGATDGVQAQSNKIVTNAQATFLTPFRELPLAIWNDVTGTDVSVTVYGTLNSASLPNNDEIWLDVQYLTSLPTDVYTTFNPADILNGTLSNGNLTATLSGAGGTRSVHSFGTGKFYFEYKYTTINTNSFITGVALASFVLGGGVVGTAYIGRVSGSIVINGVSTGVDLGIVNQGAVVGIALDTVANLIWFRFAPSGNWNNSGTANPATGTGGLSISSLSGALYGLMHGLGGDVCTANFGASAFIGSVPSGFSSGRFVSSVASAFGAFKSTSKSHPLSPAAAVASDGSTWNNATTSAVTWEAASVTAVTLSGGNLVATNTGTTSAHGAKVASADGKTSGKYYFEVTWTARTGGADQGVGVGTYASTYSGMGTTGGVVGIIAYFGGSIWSNGSNLYNGSPYSAPQVMGIAVDLDNRTFWTRRSPSGAWNAGGGADPATNTGGLAIPAGAMVPFVTFGGGGGAPNNIVTANFGASAFSGVVPSGFYSGWASIWSPFKLVATLTSPQPAMRGYIHARVMAAKPSTTYYIDPKLGLASTGGSTTGPCPVKVTKDEYSGSQVTETGITRVDGASVGGTPISTKIATNAQAALLTPYRMLPLAAWNETTGADVTVTVYGTINTALLPKNDEIWMDVQYLGDGPSTVLATLNGTPTDATLSSGNLTATHTTTNSNSGARSATVKSSGKYYFEVTIGATHGNNDSLGLLLSTGTYSDLLTTATNILACYISQSGAIWSNGSSSGKNLGASSAAGHVVGVAIDLDNRKGWFRDINPGIAVGNWNGLAIGSENPATNTGGVTIMAGSLGPVVGFGGAGTAINDAMTANFGQTAYVATAPSGFGNWAASTSSGSPLASFKSTCKSHPLATNAAVASDGSTWNGASGGTTSYSNSGGQGDRTGTIAITTDLTAGGGSHSMLLNGSEANEYWWAAGQTSKSMVFDFGVGASVVIDELTWTQDQAATHGSAQTFAGSNDNVSYTNLSTSVALGASATTVVPITNTTGYRYYRLTVPGATSSSPYIREIKFKIGSFVWTAFKLVATLTSPQPQMKGYVYASVLAAKAGTTYYVDPKVMLS